MTRDELISMLEASTEGNAILDGLLWRATDPETPEEDWWVFDDGVWCRRARDDDDDAPDLGPLLEGCGYEKVERPEPAYDAWQIPPHFTRSLEVALTLWPEGLDLQMEVELVLGGWVFYVMARPGGAIALVSDPSIYVRCEPQPTFADAAKHGARLVCIAALQARALLETTP